MWVIPLVPHLHIPLLSPLLLHVVLFKPLIEILTEFLVMQVIGLGTPEFVEVGDKVIPDIFSQLPVHDFIKLLHFCLHLAIQLYFLLEFDI